jgi:serine/threonine-protein kinase
MVERADNRQDAGVDEAVQVFLTSQLQGEAPDLDEFVKQHPGLEGQIRQKVKDCQRVSSLFDSLRHTDEREFQATTGRGNLVGKQIAAFKITEVIGCGGMGVVYKGRDSRLDRLVAVKTMPTHLLEDGATQTRFRREARLLASLNHANIGAIYDIIEQGEDAGYLILEYVPGETLTERTAREPLKLEETLAIGQQIAEAVAAAHEKGVVHRDLKPGNIKITPGGRIKVLDFGLAKASASQDRDGDITTTEPGRVLGTPAYMSPEQARGKATDHRTDIWSFGCIMFQMLTGRLPFEGETVTDTLACIIEREPDWELLPDGTPTNIRVLLRRCLEKEPDRRLGDIADAGIAIRETLSLGLLGKNVPAPAGRLRRIALLAAAVLIIVAAGIAAWLIPGKPGVPYSTQIRVVVLPFENLGPTEDEYFAAGVTDEITTRLAGIHGLRVISRQSAMQYKRSEKSVEVIARELQVDYILEGTVQRERPSDPNSRVRIRPQLIRVSDDIHVWSDIYDNDMREVFRLQSDVAEQVAQALDITLLEPERRALTSRPTENMEAYDYYLRGNEYFHRSVLENDVRIAMRMYEKAVELDPTFALAHAQLSRAHLVMCWFYYDRSEQRLEMAKQAVDKALQLNPNLAEVRLALGHYYYHAHLDCDRALKEFETARKSQPSSSEVAGWISFVQRRLGKFEQALGNIKQAYELDPLSSFLAREVGETYIYLRNYPEAERWYERAISLRPDVAVPYNRKSWLHVLWQGSTKKARAVLQEALANGKPAEEPWIIDLLVILDVYDRNYQEALDRLSAIPQDLDNMRYFMPLVQRYGQIYTYMNKNELATKYYDEARSFLEAKVQQHPEDARFHSSLGITYAGLGRKQDAIREGRLGVELLPVAKDAGRGAFRVEDLARIYVMVGEHDGAIDQIEYLLSVPGEMSIPLLRLDPAWDPLREHPRFKKLLEREE